MGIFESDKTLKRVSALEKGYEKLNKTSLSISEQFSGFKQSLAEYLKRSPEFEKDARQASKKASEYRNKAAETLEAIGGLLDTIVAQRENINVIKEEIDGLVTNLNEDYNSIKAEKDEVEIAKNDILGKIEAIEQSISEVEKTFSAYPDLSKNLQELDNFHSQVEENFNKTNQLFRTITARKNDIDKVYFEIIGFEEENTETGEKTNVPGLKEELEQAYDNLNEKSEELEEKIGIIEKNTKDKYDLFITGSTQSNEKLAKTWEDKFTEIDNKIQSLLPNALTAGLSHAFSKKKEDEDASYEKHKSQFGWGIIGLIIVSCIPFGLSIYFLKDGKEWDYIIDKIPRIVIAIIPLYLPVLWLAFASSKKMNLSKRLIEEYSHKEVLSKTFEGLSRQINSLDDDDVSEELRIKLLQNFMQVYSENPGKLISNYETSDHPIMEVLDQSYKLETAVEKLKKIPGLDKVSKILETRSEKILQKSEDMVESGLDTLDKLENGQQT